MSSEKKFLDQFTDGTPSKFRFPDEFEEFESGVVPHLWKRYRTAVK